MKDNILKVQDDVKPSMTIPSYSFPCQRKVAKIRNQALEKMRKDEIGNVAYYLLKCKRGLLLTFMILLLGIGFVLSLVLAIADKCFGEEERCSKYLYSYFILIPLTFYPFLPTNIMNILRYKKTIDDCYDWLKIKLDEVTYQKIQSLGFNDHEALRDTLSEINIEAPLLYSDPHFRIMPIKRSQNGHILQSSGSIKLSSNNKCF